MGYPTSVPSFTNKNAGDVIQPAHVNDLQTEVTAIESDLLNGFTGRLTANAGFQSSNSTIANLTVTGNAFFKADHCYLHQSASQNVSSNAWTGLNFQTEILNPSGMHSTSVNSSRITFAGSSGVYAVGAIVNFPAAGSTGDIRAKIVQNDSSDVGPAVFAVAQSIPSGLNATLCPSGLVRAASTSDFITVQAYQTVGGGPLSVPASTALATASAFWAYRISR